MEEEVRDLTSAATLSGQALNISATEDQLMVNNAEVTDTDIECTNGVIHVIDTVLLPPGDIVDVVMTDGRFTTLVGAVLAADLVETLKGEGPYTVFAPTAEAFEELPGGTLGGLL